MKVNLDKEFEIEEEVIFADFLRKKGSYYQAERLAKEYYAKQGYFVLYCPSLTDLLSGRLGYDKNYLGGDFHSDYKTAMEILSEKLDVLYYVDAIFRGFPDLIVFDIKNRSFFLVETKRNDSIMDNQVLFFIFVRDIFKICDIKLVRVKPEGSIVKKKGKKKFIIRSTIDSYVRSYNKRRVYEINLYKSIDKEMIDNLQESLTRLEKQKDTLDIVFFKERSEKIRNKVKFLKNIQYRETHALNNLLEYWASRDNIRMDKKILRKLARKVLRKKSINYEHNEFVKLKSRGRLLRTPTNDKSYIRINFNPS